MAEALMKTSSWRRLQIAVAVAGLVPVTAGGSGVLFGTAMTDAGFVSISLDSHYRYLSGLLLAIGLIFWAQVPRIAKSGPTFRLLTLVVVIGGLGRLAALAVIGVPSFPMLGGLIMELIVTPGLCLWQTWLARMESSEQRNGAGVP